MNFSSWLKQSAQLKELDQENGRQALGKNASHELTGLKLYINDTGLLYSVNLN